MVFKDILRRTYMLRWSLILMFNRIIYTLSLYNLLVGLRAAGMSNAALKEKKIIALMICEKSETKCLAVNRLSARFGKSIHKCSL